MPAFGFVFAFPENIKGIAGNIETKFICYVISYCTKSGMAKFCYFTAVFANKVVMISASEIIFKAVKVITEITFGE